MHEIEMHEFTPDFAACWRAAGIHLQRQAQGPLHSWLKANLNPPFLEHLSFRLGNQLFYVRLVDVDGNLTVPGAEHGLHAIADGCRGHACLMPMRRLRGEWVAAAPGWGLVDSRTGRPVDPVALVSDVNIEMTDWELHDFAVQIVRDTELQVPGRQLMSSQGNPGVDPSIWFAGEHGPEWVVVRASRHAMKPPSVPANWGGIAARLAVQSARGHFAAVTILSADEDFSKPAADWHLPLWRGHGMEVKYEGMQALP